MKTLSAGFENITIFEGVVFFLAKSYNFNTKFNNLDKLGRILTFYGQHPFKVDLFVFIYVILITKSVFYT